VPVLHHCLPCCRGQEFLTLCRILFKLLDCVEYLLQVPCVRWV
jgi:hypothetical protein